MTKAEKRTTTSEVIALIQHCCRDKFSTSQQLSANITGLNDYKQALNKPKRDYLAEGDLELFTGAGYFSEPRNSALVCSSPKTQMTRSARPLTRGEILHQEPLTPGHTHPGPHRSFAWLYRNLASC